MDNSNNNSNNSCNNNNNNSNNQNFRVNSQNIDLSLFGSMPSNQYNGLSTLDILDSAIELLADGIELTDAEIEEIERNQNSQNNNNRNTRPRQ